MQVLLSCSSRIALLGASGLNLRRVTQGGKIQTRGGLQLPLDEEGILGQRQSRCSVQFPIEGSSHLPDMVR